MHSNDIIMTHSLIEQALEMSMRSQRFPDVSSSPRQGDQFHGLEPCHICWATKHPPSHGCTPVHLVWGSRQSDAFEDDAMRVGFEDGAGGYEAACCWRE